jgi:hypothetical protein
MGEFVRDLNVMLHMDADVSEAEKKVKGLQQQANQGPLTSALGGLGNTATNGGAGGMTQELANGQMRDMFRDLIKTMSELSSSIKGRTASGGGGGGTGPEVEPSGPSGPIGDLGLPGLTGRKQLQGWEVQRMINNPAGSLWGMANAGWMAKAGRLAMGEAGEGLAGLGLLGSAAVAGGALVGGLKIGDMVNHGTLSSGEIEVQKRLRDASLSASVGLDFRGLTFSDDRLHPGSGLGTDFNYEYARNGLQGLGVHLGDMADSDRNGMPGFMSNMGRWSNRMGVSQEGAAGFMGQLWASGAGPKTLEGGNALLKNIEEAIKVGHRIGISGNETMQSVAAMLHMEQSRTGTVSGSALSHILSIQGGLGSMDKHLFGGSKSNDVIAAVGTNKNSIQRAGLMAYLMGAGKGEWENFKHSPALDGLNLTDYDKATIMADSPDVTRTYTDRMLRGDWKNMPLSAQSWLSGLNSVDSIQKRYGYIAGARGQFRHPGGGKDDLGSNFDSEQAASENLTAFGGQVKEYAGSGASTERLMGLLQAEAEKSKLILDASINFNKAVQSFANTVGDLVFGSFVDRGKAFSAIANPGTTVANLVAEQVKAKLLK